MSGPAFDYVALPVTDSNIDSNNPELLRMPPTPESINSELEQACRLSEKIDCQKRSANPTEN